MELELKHSELSCYRCMYSKEASQEESVEAILSDAMGDAVEIIDTQGEVFLRGKECEDGLVRIRGSIEGSVIYRNGEGETCALPFHSECRMEWTGEELKREGFLWVVLKLRAVEGRILNPRKILVRADLTGTISQWQQEVVRYVDGATGNKLETRCEECRIRMVSALVEKVFAVTEDFHLPEGKKPVETILCHTLSAQVEETHPVAGKLIVQGSATLALLCRDVEGGISSLRFSAPWSQLLDIPKEPESIQIGLMPTALYVDSIEGGETIALELHLTAQAICMDVCETELLADAYSTEYESELTLGEARIKSPAQEDIQERSLQIPADAPDDLESILFAYGEVGKRQGNVYPVRARVLYKSTGGELRLMCREQPLETESHELPAVTAVHALPTSRGMELRAELQLTRSGEEECVLRWIDAITYSEEPSPVKAGAPGLFAVRKGKDSCWELAKKYGSTVELIRQANENMGEKDTFLLIPKAR